MAREVDGYSVDYQRLRTYDHPVLMSYGTLSSARWVAMAARLADLLPDFVVEQYEGRHHLDTPHQVEPDRVAAALRQLWGRSTS